MCTLQAFDSVLASGWSRRTRYFTSDAAAKMQRPRNRQPKPQRQTVPTKTYAGPSRQGQYPNRDIPTINQIVPGASVSMVTKQDQPTGREVQGTVQDVLTRANHPRGIKVRLTDGQVGRVQRISTESNASVQFAEPRRTDFDKETSRQTGSTDIPPTRTLADYIPFNLSGSLNDTVSSDTMAESNALHKSNTHIVSCPICGTFQGDEIAVSHHVDEHLT